MTEQHPCLVHYGQCNPTFTNSSRLAPNRPHGHEHLAAGTPDNASQQTVLPERYNKLVAAFWFQSDYRARVTAPCWPVQSRSRYGTASYNSAYLSAFVRNLHSSSQVGAPRP
jgi:hypothetical protein